MSRLFEVIDTTSHRAKLTITATRVTIKIPNDTPNDVTDKVVTFFNKIANEYPSPEKTIRGQETVERILSNGITIGTQRTVGNGKKKQIVRDNLKTIMYNE